MDLPAVNAPASGEVTLGILAGGRGTRLGGVEKAWLTLDGQSQVERLAQRLAPSVAGVLVSANRGLERFAAAGLVAVPDLRPGIGPLAGLEALAAATTTAWLLTIPVDLVNVNDCLLRRLAACGPSGAFAVDDEGTQPLVALWQVPALRAGLQDALAANELAVHALQARLGMAALRLAGVRFGNLNTPADLDEAGIGTQ